jgi:hypothetical protein
MSWLNWTFEELLHWLIHGETPEQVRAAEAERASQRNATMRREALRRLAAGSLRRRRMVRHVFLSFVVEDKPTVEMFRGQAKNKNNDLEFDDYSVQTPFDSNDAAYIRSKIKERINSASVSICLIGATTASSRWVDWEVQTAVDLSKTVFGVRLFGDKNHSIPAALNRNNKKTYGWNIDDVVAAIG